MPTLFEQTYTVVVYDAKGTEVYREQEPGYSPMGIMTQLAEKAASGQRRKPRCTHRCNSGRDCGGCGCDGCGYTRNRQT